MHFREFFAFLLLFGPMSAHSDSLYLSNGEIIVGRFVSGDGQTIRFEDAEHKVRTVGINDVEKITFQAQTRTNVRNTPANIGNSSSTAVPSGPLEQQQFCAIVSSYKEAARRYALDANPMKSADRPSPAQYEKQSRAIFGDPPEIHNWVGQLRFAEMAHYVRLSFVPDCNSSSAGVIEFATSYPRYNNSREERASLISIDSPIAEALHDLRQSERVVVSGDLFKFGKLDRINSALSVANGLGGGGTYQSTVNPGGASVDQPQYLMRFTSVKPASANAPSTASASR